MSSGWNQTCAAVYRQRHLVKATEVTAGLAESNGSLLPGLWRDSLHVTCGLTACTPGSAPGPTLGNEYGKTLPLVAVICSRTDMQTHRTSNRQTRSSQYSAPLSEAVTYASRSVSYCFEAYSVDRAASRSWADSRCMHWIPILSAYLVTHRRRTDILYTQDTAGKRHRQSIDILVRLHRVLQGRVGRVVHFA